MIQEKRGMNYEAFWVIVEGSLQVLLYFISVEDVSDLWPTVKKGFEERLPFKRASLNNKTRNPVLVDELPAEFILTTDARLRSRFPQEQSLFWFREPYATIVLVTCEVRLSASEDMCKLITLSPSC